MRAGRPTKYNSKILKKTQEYINSCNDSYKDVVVMQNGDIDRVEKKLDVNIPTLEGLAVYLAVHYDTLFEWAKKHERFSDMIDNLRKIQANRLIANGLAGTYNSTITKLLLVKHGYRDEVKNELDFTPTQVIINANKGNNIPRETA